MPQRRAPQRPSLIGRFGAALAIVGVLALTPAVGSAAYAQGIPDFGFMGPRGAGPRVSGSSGIAVPGQTQACRPFPGALADFEAFYGPYPTPSWDPLGFPVYASYNVPPFGGYWGFYTGVGPICAWQPR